MENLTGYPPPRRTLSFCALVYISEMLFPEYGVHFIAVNDGVDSVRGDSEFTAIRNVFNDNLA